MSETQDPLASLLALSENPAKLFEDRKVTFYGPDSTFAHAAKEAKSEDKSEDESPLHKALKSLSKALSDYESPPWSPESRQRYWQLALYLVGNQDDPELRFDLATTINLLSEPNEKAIVRPPTESEKKSLEPAAARVEARNVGWDKRPEKWTAADWRLLGFVQDWQRDATDTDTDSVIERTPIFLANAQSGTALVLVVERLPGPPRLITPHWWRLGLIPLKKERKEVKDGEKEEKELPQAISDAILAVLGTQPDERFQFRWWLEPMLENRWPDAIALAESNEMSAAIAAKALLDRTPGSPPLLDPKVGISGTLNGSPGTSLHEWRVGRVDRVVRKMEAAEQAGVLTFLLNEESAKQVTSDKPSVQPVESFDDAYEASLCTCSHLQQYKQSEAAHFIAWEDKETVIPKMAKPSECFLEMETHPDFMATDDERATDQRRAEVDARFQQSPGVEHFLLDQPIWQCDAPPEERWPMAEAEHEPDDDGSQSAHQPSGERAEFAGTWNRISRDTMLEYAISDDPAWHRVGVVCGAGLGKTTNLNWLAARINRRQLGRDKNLAVFMELSDFELLKDQEKLKNELVTRINNRKSGKQDLTDLAVERMLTDGRITFLLDSLDQANPDPNGKAVKALVALLDGGKWKACRVWVSGRPYAFRMARKKLETLKGNPPWQFLRIGQLDEPECRQLLETFRRPGNARLAASVEWSSS